MLHTTKRRKANWIGHILRRNCLLKHASEGSTGRRGRRGKQLRDDHKEMRKYWNFKAESPDCTLRITSFKRGCGPVSRQTA